MPENQEQKPDLHALVVAGLAHVDEQIKLFEGKSKAFQEEHIKVLSELREANKKLDEEKAAKGYVSPEVQAKFQVLDAAVSRFEAEMLRPDGGRKAADALVTPGSQLVEDEDYKKWAENDFRTQKGFHNRTFNLKGGFFPVGAKHDDILSAQKSAITTGGLGFPTVAVLQSGRQAGIIQLPRIELRIRDLMRVRPMTMPQVDYLKESAWTSGASTQTEGVSKGESTVTFTTMTARATTVAHHMNVTKQALRDMPELRAEIDSLMMYGLKLEEERQILAGDGVGAHINGIITQATAYASGTYNIAADSKLDKLRHMIRQSRLAFYAVDGIVLNPRDLHDIELIKEEPGGVANKGRYIVGDPKTGPEVMFIWGKPVVESDAISYGFSLVGAFKTGADLFDREQATIDISFEHANNFIENKATILVEEAIALAVKRPGSFIYGAL